jgi:hypothetical protein
MKSGVFEIQIPPPACNMSFGATADYVQAAGASASDVQWLAGLRILF